MNDLYKWIVLIVGMTIMLSSFLSWLCFARLTMARIERQMVKEGLDLPLWDRRAGFRVPGYAIMILRPKKPGTMLLYNTEAIQRLATKKDWYLALWLEVSLVGTLIFAVVFSIISN